MHDQTADFPISELRWVVLKWRNPKTGEPVIGVNNYTTHMCHVSQVDALVQASVRLHYTEGNIHIRENRETGEAQAYEPLNNLYEIVVERVSPTRENYWWCNPSLHAKEPGAHLVRFAMDSRLWDDVLKVGRAFAHPDLLQKEKEDWFED